MRTPLQKGEEVLLITYTSWIKLIVPVLVALIGIVASYFIGFLEWGWIVALAGALYFILTYATWKCNIWAVTNYRVIDETGLFNHYAKESPLEKINNVSYNQSLLGRIFNYGHVVIQTAAEAGATTYHDVHGPKRLKDTIMLAQSDYKNLQLASQAQHMANAMGIQQGGDIKYTTPTQVHIASELEKLYQLKQQGIISEDEYLRAKSKLLG